MTLLKKHAIYFLSAAILFELFLIIGVLVADGQEIIRHIDVQTFRAFVDIRTPGLTETMRWITDLGNYEFILHTMVVVGLLMAVFGHIEISLGIISSIALSNYVTNLMKNFFHIFRPDNFVMKVNGWSYPSGHTSGAAILAIMIIWAVYSAIPCRHRVLRIVITAIATLYALSVAVSRLYLGVHWLSDIVGGILLAGAVGVLMMGILKPVIMKRKQHDLSC